MNDVDMVLCEIVLWLLMTFHFFFVIILSVILMRSEIHLKRNFSIQN